ncbi:helix-turn-helix domain-containing protein [Streptomyces sp. NPDC047072]|uniref:AraC-like ligand-binding domain-containing protein n=1 Tax=Streptomyces sp. NPDC047072 TaxID=3154809 RepID=UPI00340BB9D8
MTDSKSSLLRGIESFEAAASSLFAPLRVTDPGPPVFRATVDHTAIGPVTVTRIYATAATVTRGGDSITSTDQELMHLTLHHRGRLIATQDDRTTVLKPGEMFACDNTRPYRLIGAAPSDMTVLCVPRTSLGRHADSIGRRTALPVSPQSGVGRLLSCTLSGLHETRPSQAPARMHLADAVTSLLLAAFTDTTPEVASVASSLADRIRAYVLANLDDDQLSAEGVARLHQISVRHLHKLFQGGDLTFAAWVRHERLLRIRRDLLTPAFADRSTAAIAARWGVLDTKHLGRALKREFGENVNDLRRRHRES